MKKYLKEWREKNIEQQKINRDNWRRKNPDKMREINRKSEEKRKQNGKQKQYLLENKERFQQINKKWREENKDLLEIKKKQYYEQNKEKTINTVKRWQSENKEKVRVYRIKNETNRKLNGKGREYKRNRRKTNPQYRLKLALSGRIRSALKSKGIKKYSTTMELCGCSISHLKKYLESLFTDGMSWENYGLYGWHIDHIIPCASFDLTNPVQQKKCFHYTNLQPLWADINIDKSNKLNYAYKESKIKEKYITR